MIARRHQPPGSRAPPLSGSWARFSSAHVLVHHPLFLRAIVDMCLTGITYHWQGIPQFQLPRNLLLEHLKKEQKARIAIHSFAVHRQLWHRVPPPRVRLMPYESQNNSIRSFFGVLGESCRESIPTPILISRIYTRRVRVSSSPVR